MSLTAVLHLILTYFSCFFVPLYVLTCYFPSFSFAEESKQRREMEPIQEPETKKARSQSPVIEDFTLPPFSPDNPIGKRSTTNDTNISAKLLAF